jgi:hypothetical protein
MSCGGTGEVAQMREANLNKKQALKLLTTFAVERNINGYYIVAIVFDGYLHKRVFDCPIDADVWRVYDMRFNTFLGGE